jgi:predicted transcriptional regulator
MKDTDAVPETPFKVFSVRLSEGLYDEASAFAQEIDRPLSWVVRTALRAYIKESK